MSAWVDGRLQLANLLNDFATLVRLTAEAVDRASWLDAFLLAAGANQVVEDYLHPDALAAARLAPRVAHLPAPAGRLASTLVREASRAFVTLRARRPEVARCADWQRRWSDQVVRPLAAHLTGGTEVRPPRHVPGTAGLPTGLRRSLIRLPACFRGFDLQIEDVQHLAAGFASRWPDRERPLVVVGLRTAGSYLGPLLAADLERGGYVDIHSLTIRPNRTLLPTESAVLRDRSAAGSLALLTDDPPSRGSALTAGQRLLQRHGFASEAIVLLVPVLGSENDVPPIAREQPSVILPERVWAVHQRLTPESVRASLNRLLAPARVTSVERLALAARTWRRGHVQARYLVRLDDETEHEVYVSGQGLGYLGAHALAVAGRLDRYVPVIYGMDGGLLFREWLPEQRQLSRLDARPLAAGVAEYVARRSVVLGTREDLSLCLADRDPVWQVAGYVLGRAFRRASPVLRPLLQRTSRHLLRSQRPCVVDGSTDLSRWFVRDDGGVHKIEFAEHAFSNLDRACFDPVYDVAGAVAGLDDDLHASIVDAYEQATGEHVDPERMLLYSIVQSEKRQRMDPSRALAVERACARAMQRYLHATVFADAVSARSGAVCGIDVDGVLEIERLGFPALTPGTALALRALSRHGYRPILVSGRGLAEMRDRCRAYGLAGSVAEYGAAIYLRAGDLVHEMLSSDGRTALDKVRSALASLPGAHIDPEYARGVRAFRVGPHARRVGLDPDVIARLLAETDGVRAIRGNHQTDFMVTDVDKGSGVRALLELLGEDRLALAIGDSASDLPMLALAERPRAPANADETVRRGGVPQTRGVAHVGFIEAVTELLGHPIGGCARCRPARLDRRARLLLAAFGGQDVQRLGTASQALKLAALLVRSAGSGR